MTLKAFWGGKRLGLIWREFLNMFWDKVSLPNRGRHVILVHCDSDLFSEAPLKQIYKDNPNSIQQINIFELIDRPYP